MQNDVRWIYNDVDRAFAEAENKPLLVVLRCVPCLSCVGLDAQVLTEPELNPLADFSWVPHRAGSRPISKAHGGEEG